MRLGNICSHGVAGLSLREHKYRSEPQLSLTSYSGCIGYGGKYFSESALKWLLCVYNNIPSVIPLWSGKWLPCVISTNKTFDMRPIMRLWWFSFFTHQMVERCYILAWQLLGGLVRCWSYFGFCLSQRLLKLAAMVGFSLCLRKSESEPPKSLFVLKEWGFLYYTTYAA